MGIITAFKILLLAILFVISGGALFTEWARRHKFLVALSVIFSIAAAYYLFRDVYDDLKRDVTKDVATQSVASSEPAQPDPPPDAASIELAYWRSISSSEDIAAFEAYLEKYPDGEFASLARSRIKELRAKEEQRKQEEERRELERQRAEKQRAEQLEAERLEAERKEAENLEAERREAERRQARDRLLQSIKVLDGEGSIVIYPRCTNCAYSGYLYIATPTIYVSNESDSPVDLAVLANSLNIGSCSGNQFNTRGLLALEGDKPMNPGSFTTLLSGGLVAVTTNLNERCLEPLLQSSAANVSLVLLVKYDGEISRLPILARNVTIRRTNSR